MTAEGIFQQIRNPVTIRVGRRLALFESERVSGQLHSEGAPQIGRGLWITAGVQIVEVVVTEINVVSVPFRSIACETALDSYFHGARTIGNQPRRGGYVGSCAAEIQTSRTVGIRNRTG